MTKKIEQPKLTSETSEIKEGNKGNLIEAVTLFVKYYTMYMTNKLSENGKMHFRNLAEITKTSKSPEEKEIAIREYFKTISRKDYIEIMKMTKF